jgi:hypothetical protein
LELNALKGDCLPTTTHGLSSYDEHEPRLFALSRRLDRKDDALLKEALEDLLARYESVIVDRSVDINAIVEPLVKGGYYHAGQVCVSVQRIFIHADILPSVVERLTERVRMLRVGDPGVWAMLGPGVWPIDARHFGRKRINFRVFSDRLISACVFVYPVRVSICRHFALLAFKDCTRLLHKVASCHQCAYSRISRDPLAVIDERQFIPSSQLSTLQGNGVQDERDQFARSSCSF